jgi:hypothetical protein
MPSEKFTEVSRAFRRRLGCVLAVREGLRFTFAWNMFWAGAVVALRGVWLVDRWLLLWGAAGLAVAAAAAAIITLRKLPAPAVIRAVLDRHGGLGGLLMADGDVDIGSWASQIGRVPAPALGWRYRRPLMLWAASAAFVVAAFLMPDRALSAGGNALQIGGDIRKLADQLQVLTREQLVPPEKAKILEKDLERVREDAQGNDPAKTMEAMDNLAQSFRKTAAEAAESAIRQTEALSREQLMAKTLDKALKTPESEKDPKKLNEAMQALAKMTAQSAEENNALSQNLSNELKEACRKGELSEKQLEELSKDLAEAMESEEAKVARLADARLVDADDVERCKAAGEEAGEELDAKELAAALAKCQGGSPSDEADLAAFLAGQSLGTDTSELKELGLPGRGGLTRGPAPAAMTWTEGAEKDGAAFKAKVLAPGAVNSLKNSRLTRVSSGDPGEAQPGHPLAGRESSGGALNAAQAGGGEAHTQLILPEHEKTVQRYFERGKK